MANHNINVKLRNGKGKSKTSANGSVHKISQRMNGSSPNSTKSLARNFKAINTLDASQMGLFGGVSNSSISIAQEVVKFASKIADLALDINMARTGESIAVGNMRKLKRYILNPISYLSDGSYEYVLNDFRIARQNTEKDYYRELSGNLIVGNQYGSKK